MSRYGRLAMARWQDTDPDRLAALADPLTFFAQVEDLTDRIAGDDPPAGQTYLEKVNRLIMARSQAQEIVLADLTAIEPPVHDTAQPTPQSTPEPMSLVDDVLTAIHRAAQDPT